MTARRPCRRRESAHVAACAAAHVAARAPVRALALAVALCAGVVAGCASGAARGATAGDAAAGDPGLPSAGAEGAAVIAAFDAAVGAPRFLAILSPTCPACLRGARAVADEVVARRTDGVPGVYVVWGAVLPADDARSAQEAARLLDAPGVRQYWDADMAFGRLVGASLGTAPQPYAWDVYAFFEWDATFEDGVPNPTAWAHQLQGTQPQRHHAPDALAHFLRETTVSLPLESAGDAPSR